MKVVAFITEYAAVDRIIDHLKLTFVAEKPPPSHVIEQVVLMAAEDKTGHARLGDRAAVQASSYRARI